MGSLMPRIMGQVSLKRREMWFLAGVRMCVRVCVRVYVSDFQRLKPR